MEYMSVIYFVKKKREKNHKYILSLFGMRAVLEGHFSVGCFIVIWYKGMQLALDVLFFNCIVGFFFLIVKMYFCK